MSPELRTRNCVLCPRNCRNCSPELPAEEMEGTLFESPELLKAIDEIYRYPLRQSATDTLNRQLRSGVSDEVLSQLVIALRDEDRLCLTHEEDRETQDPQIICSMGLVEKE